MKSSLTFFSGGLFGVRHIESFRLVCPVQLFVESFFGKHVKRRWLPDNWQYKKFGTRWVGEYTTADFRHRTPVYRHFTNLETIELQPCDIFGNLWERANLVSAITPPN
jgi:hypothetical protein